jgi:ElaB/YqjD/DUF883 family membrane-anchored ribosome-binding protein
LCIIQGKKEIIKWRTTIVTNNSEARKIMTKPLPQILDEIEDSIRLADEAAKNARDAAVEVRKTGEKAVNEATRIANERITKVEQIAKNAMQLAELLKLAVMDGVTAVDKRLLEKAPNIESAPKK